MQLWVTALLLAALAACGNAGTLKPRVLPEAYPIQIFRKLVLFSSLIA